MCEPNLLSVWANWILQTSEAISSGNIERILMIFFLGNRLRRALFPEFTLIFRLRDLRVWKWNLIGWNFTEISSMKFHEISLKFHRVWNEQWNFIDMVNLYFLWYLLHLTTSVSVDHQFGQICQLLCLFGPFWDSGIDRHNLPQLKDIFTNSPRESLKTSLQL